MNSIAAPGTTARPAINPGYYAVLITILIWAGFFISLRAGAKSILSTADIALIRFGVPALFLAVMAWRRRSKILATRKRYLLGILCGAGVPFFFMNATGMHYAPVAHGSTLVPGTLPLFVTTIALLFYKETLSRHRAMGLVFIIIGILVLLGSAISDTATNQWQGHVMFLGSSLLWACFTISMRMSGLTALEGAAVFSIGSMVILAALGLGGLIESHMHEAPVEQLLLQFVLQGLLVGLVAGFCYGYAIAQLGAEKTAAIGAFTPVLASLIAIPVFNELVDFNSGLGMVLITIGTLFASHIFYRSSNSPT
jgi:drug/metabolite transporter (DMT)-like permease